MVVTGDGAENRLSRGRQDLTPVPVEPSPMNLFDWHARFEGDPRVLALSTAIRDDSHWLYVECTSARAATSLLRDLQRWGHLTMGRRNRTSLWLEVEQE